MGERGEGRREQNPFMTRGRYLRRIGASRFKLVFFVLSPWVPEELYTRLLRVMPVTNEFRAVTGEWLVSYG